MVGRSALATRPACAPELAPERLLVRVFDSKDLWWVTASERRVSFECRELAMAFALLTAVQAKRRGARTKVLAQDKPGRKLRPVAFPGEGWVRP